jgi:hypothetical protein
MLAAMRLFNTESRKLATTASLRYALVLVPNSTIQG